MHLLLLHLFIMNVSLNGDKNSGIKNIPQTQTWLKILKKWVKANILNTTWVTTFKCFMWIINNMFWISYFICVMYWLKWVSLCVFSHFCNGVIGFLTCVFKPCPCCVPALYSVCHLCLKATEWLLMWLLYNLMSCEYFCEHKNIHFQHSHATTRKWWARLLCFQGPVSCLL